MRNVVVGLLIVFSSPMFSYADDPVPLEVWRVNKSNPFRGVYNMFCYLPNFRNGEGKNAIVIRKRSWEDKVDRMETWYNRDMNDTLNQFTWAATFCPSETPDINGDGQRDFFNGSTLFIGKQNDEPDFSKTYKVNGSGYVGYAKLNDDNCDDIYYYGNIDVSDKSMAHFVFGNSTLKKFQTYTVISKYATADTQSYERPKAIYKNKQGQWRLLTHCKGWIQGTYTTIWQSKKTVLRLYSLEFKKITDDSTAVITTQIDEYKDPKWLDYEDNIHTKTPLNWLPVNDAGLLYSSEHFSKTLYYASFNTLPDKVTKEYNSYAVTLDLTEDRISILRTGIDRLILIGKVLKHSVDGDDREDIIRQDGDGKTLFLSVNDSGIPFVKSFFDTKSVLSSGRMEDAFSIGDVTSDGIPDIACLYINNSIGNAFVIIKGKNIVSTIAENSQINFSIDTPYPLPNNSQIVIPLVCTVEDNYSLYIYDLQGKKYTIFEHKFLNEGRVSYPYPTNHLPNGIYIIRFTDGEQVVEKTILIQH